MNAQTQTQTQDVTVSNSASAPVLAPAERVQRGKGFVTVQRFSNTGSASAVRALLKAADPTLSAKALSRKVGETLRGERDLRNQLAVAWLQGRMSAGDIASHGEVSSNGSVLRLKSLPEPQAAPAPAPKTAEEIRAEIEKLNAALKAIEQSN